MSGAQPGGFGIAVGAAAADGSMPPVFGSTFATIAGAMAPVQVSPVREIVDIGPHGETRVTGHIQVAPTPRPPNVSSVTPRSDAAGPTYTRHWQSGQVRLDGAPAEPAPAPKDQPQGLRELFQAPQQQSQPSAPAAKQAVFDGGATFGSWRNSYVGTVVSLPFIIVIEDEDTDNQPLPVDELSQMNPQEDGWLALRLDVEPNTVYKVTPLIDYTFEGRRYITLYAHDRRAV